ncbi:MAG: hypothetical protein DMG69_01380 [Acidobacteria bacterium]|nr:MAG: hypothetical protein DMG69_01380 [Acidobacteriota bacterium]
MNVVLLIGVVPIGQQPTNETRLRAMAERAILPILRSAGQIIPHPSQAREVPPYSNCDTTRAAAIFPMPYPN